MTQAKDQEISASITTLNALAACASYSFLDVLNCDPDATEEGVDHAPRQVFTGHFVPVKPTPIQNPEYIAHSPSFFAELGLADSLAQSDDFMRVFSGNLSQAPEPMQKVGWACGYALSIFGTEYTQQCPFRTGNGYGDGRAISVFEAVINGQRWEMQLKGGGRTPYCRGADGRAVLRSSVREFLAQEHMHALGVPTSRSLCLYVSKTEKVQRPWYSAGSYAKDPDRYFLEPVAISTRVAPSFIRVGQLELFGRRARNQAHPRAMEELEKLVLHLMDREYGEVIDTTRSLEEKVLVLAGEFCGRLTSLVANWIRVGYCQGNFNSDNCAAGGFTLDYGPFGFCEAFNPYFQPWTGGGQHFAFLNQPIAAERNFQMFCAALRPLLSAQPAFIQQLDKIQANFPRVMQAAMETMWAAKLGLVVFNAELFNELITLMMQTPVDYTLFFRELSTVPNDIEPLTKSFYTELTAETDNEGLHTRWAEWFIKWKSLITSGPRSTEEISIQMQRANPKYIMREGNVVPAYQHAARGQYALIKELQGVLTQPYAEQSQEIEEQYYRLKPAELFGLGGFSHYSCSS
ncbi:protein adenylyltransferase SelO [Nitrincola iocasae]|uniref:Protein nucleotidyltransferase YdiU n=1 Tax=Nitrincola iocasae TaxID=2614693 RepID=A0A5J6LDF1_9GAMM|nr:protein adenylyltransferase SelO family protein [Nitrincola iocasae]QEW06396.1 hypothetical protein F5I99_07690 [Nitrincola iocasae]